MNVYLVIALLIISAFIGFWLGNKYLKRKIKKDNDKILINAKKFLNGEIDNKTEIEGKMVDVNKFIIKDDSGKEELIEYGNAR